MAKKDKFTKNTKFAGLWKRIFHMTQSSKVLKQI